MCLSTVYRAVGNDEEELCKFVSSIDVEGSTLTFTDVVGTVVTVEGVIEHVDLVGGRIVVRAA